VRRRFCLSLKGLTLRSLTDIAGQMGFATRPDGTGDAKMRSECAGRNFAQRRPLCSRASR
jgi:hypothetical protein